MTCESHSVPLPSEKWTTLNSQHITHHLNQLAALSNQTQAQAPHSSVQLSTALPPISDIPIHIYDIVDSTNTVLWQHIRRSTDPSQANPSQAWQEGQVAIARQQSAGRGQWGRQWQSSLGGLYLSMALRPNCPTTVAAQITLSVVVGVAIALRLCHIPVWIKWPNDLVVPSTILAGPQPNHLPTLYKLGGILTETRIQGQTVSHAVVGLGLNGANPVPPQGINLQTLWSKIASNPTDSDRHLPLTPCLMSLNGIAAIAIWGIRSGWQRWQQQGIDPIIRDYNTFLSHRDQSIQVKYQGQSVQSQSVQGKILGVSASGHLRLRPTSLSSPIQVNSSDVTGTSSLPQSSSQEILLTPGSVHLGYQLNP
ncbi:MAG: biotin--[acetyl-CoA-carboxylase] ligase [Cyanothece sp. SIO2G6]|nr:biotin--[acetyl-CoA-carboxylase] ligase [Cyanothece sp. SIO2G6]